MRRTLLLFVPVVFISACRLPPEREPLKPLPEEGPMFTYGEILGRARLQAATALDAFYIDAWKDLEDAARGLEQTVRFLPRSFEQPASVKELIGKEGPALQKEAQRLLEAARKQSSDSANEALTRINQHIRTLRPKEDAKKEESKGKEEVKEAPKAK